MRSRPISPASAHPGWSSSPSATGRRPRSSRWRRGVLAEAAPALRPPRPVRRSGHEPRFVAAEPGTLAGAVVDAAAAAVADVAPGTVAVLAPASLVGELALALDDAGYHAIDPRRDGLGSPLSLLPVDLANGLEFDAVVVVEPSTIADESLTRLAGSLRGAHPAHPAPRRGPRAAAADVPPPLTAPDLG